MATTRSIRVLVVPVGKDPEVRVLPREGFGLAVERLVGGPFAGHLLDEEDGGGAVQAYVNDEGMAAGMPRTCLVSAQYLHGTVVVSRSNAEGKSVDLTDDDLEVYKALLGRKYQAWNHGVLFEGDEPRARVLELSLETAPRLVWLPLEDGGRITGGLQTLLDGVYDAYPLQEDPDGGGLDAHVNMLAKESGMAKNQSLDGRWLHGTVVVGRRHPQVGFVDLTEADLETCAARLGIDLEGIVPRAVPEVTVVPMEPGEL